MAKKEMTKNESLHIKKVNKRKLSGSLEFTTSRLASQVTGVGVLLLALWQVVLPLIRGKEISPVMGIVTAVFGVEFILQYIIVKRIEKEVTGVTGEITNATRKLGILLIPFVVTGNFLLFIAGAMLVKKEKNLEYQLSVYSLLVNIFVILVSLLNLFKDALVDTFWLGIGFYSLYAVLNIVIIWAVNKYTFGKKPDKKFMPFAIVCLLGIALGNVFSFVLGLITIGKYRNKNEEVSVEWIDVIQRLFRNYTAVIGMFFVVFFIGISIGSNLTFDYDIAISNNFVARLAEPSLMYPFGCDDYGRCVFTRIVFGASISLIIGMISTIVPIILGGILGAVAGFYGGRRDNVIMRVMDVLNAVPSILLAIAIIAAFGVSTVNLILALSISVIPSYARTVRAQVMGIANQEFVEAAKACGAKNGTIIFKHIIPNSLAPVIVQATMGIGSAVLSTSSLSYLGIGVEAHVPEWGNVLKAGSTFLETNPYIAIFPGLAIIIIVLAFNFFGDGLRDALDPKLK
ncbi:ABC transporter permease [Roseburia hominis]